MTATISAKNRWHPVCRRLAAYSIPEMARLHPRRRAMNPWQLSPSSPARRPGSYEQFIVSSAKAIAARAEQRGSLKRSPLMAATILQALSTAGRVGRLRRTDLPAVDNASSPSPHGSRSIVLSPLAWDSRSNSLGMT